MLHVRLHMRITELTTWFSKMATLLTYFDKGLETQPR